MARETCPFWVGYLLASRVRRWIHDPEKILRPYVKPGMTALDVGSAMGFFSLPLARMVGKEGRVICLDIQPKMLQALQKRALRAGVADRIIPRLAREGSLNLEDFAGTADFALAFAVIHEIDDVPGFFQDLVPAIKSGGRLLIAEPKVHVPAGEFQTTLSAAQERGLTVIARPQITWSHTALLSKK